MRVRIKYEYNRSSGRPYEARTRFGFLWGDYAYGSSAASFEHARERLLENVRSRRARKEGVPEDEIVEL